MLWVEGTPGGLRLAVWPSLFVGHPPVVVPWADVAVAPADSGSFLSRRVVDVGGVTLRVRPALGQAIGAYQAGR